MKKKYIYTHKPIFAIYRKLLQFFVIHTQHEHVYIETIISQILCALLKYCTQKAASSEAEN